MTFIAFAFTPDKSSVVMAADTGLLGSADAPQGFTPHSMTRIHKLHRVGDRALMWGLAGSAADIGPFRKWIDGAVFETWDDLTTQASDQISTMHVEALARAHKAKQKKDDVQNINVLVAGYLDAPQAVLFTQDGTVNSFLEMDRLHGFAGPCMPVAETVLHTANELGLAQSLSDPPTMEKFVTGISTTVPILATPVDVWKVTPDGCTPENEGAREQMDQEDG